MSQPFHSKMRKRGVVVQMESSKARSSKSDEEPAEKRRRVEEEKESKKKSEELDDDEMWDDFTQEDMQKIDFLESQAISHLPAEPSSTTEQPVPSTSGSGSFIKPQQVAKKHSNTSSSSSSSNGLLSGSSYPSQPSGASGPSSSSLEHVRSSLSSHSSGEGPRLARGRASSGDGGGPQSQSKEIEDLKNEKMKLDGEIKILREGFVQKDKIIAKFQEEKAQWMERQVVEKSERERALQAENDHLKTQMEFLKREMAEYKEHAAKHQTEQGARTPEKKSPTVAKAGEVSPRPIRVTRGMKWKESRKTEEPRAEALPQGSASLPATSASSPSAEASPAPRRKKDAKGAQPKVSVSTKFTQCPVGPPVGRNFRLRGPRHSGKMPGSHLVARLFEQKLGAGGEVVDRGLVGLLHLSTPDMDLQLLRRSSSMPTTPAKSQSFRSQDLLAGRLTQPKNYLQAVEGIQKLLTEDEVFSLVPLSHPPPVSRPPGTVYLLPLLGDYLVRYVSLLSSLSAKEASADTSSHVGSKSSSSESTLGSGSASLELMLREGTSRANLLETTALSALFVLHKLAKVCPAVVRLVMGVSLPLTPARSLEPKASSSSSSAMETDQARESGMEGDDEASSPSLESNSSASLLTSVSEMNILQQLSHIANPTEEPCKSNLQCVETALDILVTLAKHAPPELLDRMSGLASRGILTNCLKCGKISIMSKTVLLMTALGGSSAPLTLCTASGSCPVLLMYSIGVVDPKAEEEAAMEEVYRQILDFAWNVCSRGPQGFQLLLEAECQCSLELVPCLVNILYRRLRSLQMSAPALVGALGAEEGERQSLASQVLLLLQTLAHNDPNFVERHAPVQPLYVFPLSVLVAALRLEPDVLSKYDAEFTALYDLWDINQDDSELNLESDQDPNASMET